MDTQALFKIGYGLYMLSAAKEGRDNGCIINTAMQVTNAPDRVAVAVNKRNYTRDMIVHTGRLCISVLTEDAPFSLFQRFGFQSGRTVNKFENFTETGRSESGLLYLTAYSNAWMEGAIHSALDLGTHTLFIADVTDAAVLSDRETATYAYYHKHIKPAPEKSSTKGWRCKICGYIDEGETLPPDYICPLCEHGASGFEPVG